MNRRTWKGGHIHRQKNKADLYVIERQIRSKRYHVSTRCHTLAAAMEQLERFERSPDTYDPGGDTSGVVVVTGELVMEFRTWLITRDRPTTTKHANEMAHRMGEWAADLKGRDLRRVDLRTYKELAEKRGAGRQHRIIALKSFCAWMRTEKFAMTRAQDASIDLAVPQGSPEKYRREKAVPLENVLAVLRVLPPAYRDCLMLTMSTGIHVTELGRFARTEEAQIGPARDDALGVLIVLHKSGRDTGIPLRYPEVLEAAQRIRESRSVPGRLNATLAKACAAAGVPKFTFGVSRHTVATWAAERGSNPRVIMEYLGHTSEQTHRRNYVKLGVPTRAPNLPRLIF